MRKILGLAFLLVAATVYFNLDFVSSAQSPSRITQRCPAPNGSIYGSAGFAAAGNLLVNPCPNKGTYFNGNVSINGNLSVNGNINGNIVPFSSANSGGVVFVGTAGQLAQNSDTFLWSNTSTRLIVGFNASESTTTNLEINRDQANAVESLVAFGTARSGILDGYMARGTRAIPTATQADDTLLLLTGRGFGASAFPSASRLRLLFGASENWTDAAQGTYLSIFLTGTGGVTTSNFFRFYSTSFNAASGVQFGWTSGATNPTTATLDTGFARYSAGVIRSTNGGTSITGLIGGGAAVASAAAMPLPTGRVFHVTGTTNITSITSTNFASGACITLIFDGVLTFTDGSNLVLAGNFVTTADDTISLCYDGTNWYETARSVN